jgi:hypothetical protein
MSMNVLLNMALDALVTKSSPDIATSLGCHGNFCTDPVRDIVLDKLIRMFFKVPQIQSEKPRRTRVCNHYTMPLELIQENHERSSVRIGRNNQPAGQRNRKSILPPEPVTVSEDHQKPCCLQGAGSSNPLFNVLQQSVQLTELISAVHLTLIQFLAFFSNERIEFSGIVSRRGDVEVKADTWLSFTAILNETLDFTLVDDHSLVLPDIPPPYTSVPLRAGLPKN